MAASLLCYIVPSCLHRCIYRVHLITEQHSRQLGAGPLLQSLNRRAPPRAASRSNAAPQKQLATWRPLLQVPSDTHRGARRSIASHPVDVSSPGVKGCRGHQTGHPVWHRCQASRAGRCPAPRFAVCNIIQGVLCLGQVVYEVVGKEDVPKLACWVDEVPAGCRHRHFLRVPKQGPGNRGRDEGGQLQELMLR